MLRTCEITAADLDGDSVGAKRSSAPFLKALHELSRMSHSWMDGSCSADDEIAEEPRRSEGTTDLEGSRTSAVTDIEHALSDGWCTGWSHSPAMARRL
jgi:hypothetical protein